MRKSGHIILLAFLFLLFAACGHYSKESEHIGVAFEQAQHIYGEGENDTVLFIPELDKASAYYARKKDYRRAALSALYQGYAEKDYNRTVAMNAFKVAERYGKLIHDSLTVARAQYQMGNMLCNDGVLNDALMMFKNSTVNFGNRYTEKALVLNAEACTYILLNDYANADTCLSQSLFFAEQGFSEGAKQKTLNNYAVLYRVKGEYDKALDYLKMVKPQNDQQKVLNQLNFGNVFLAIGEMDSAAYYFSQMENLLSEVNIKDETKASAYASLSRFAERQGDYAKAVECLKNKELYIVKVKDRIEKDGLYRVQQQYDYETFRNEMSEKIIVRQRIILLMSLVVLFVFLLLIILQKRMAVIQKREKEAKERTLLYLQQYFAILEKQGQTMQKLAIVMDNKEDKALLDNLRATVFGKKEPWEAMMEIFDTLHPKERERIRRQYPKLTEMEQKVIILSYFNVSRQDEALFLKTSIHTIDKLRISVKKKTQISL